jgi:hypothetical protein
MKFTNGVLHNLLYVLLHTSTISQHCKKILILLYILYTSCACISTYFIQNMYINFDVHWIPSNINELASYCIFLGYVFVLWTKVGNDAPYPDEALVEPSLQSSIFSSSLWNMGNTLQWTQTSERWWIVWSTTAQSSLTLIWMEHSE